VEASTLRWILIIVGIVIVGSIFLFGNPDKKRKPKASRKIKEDMPQRREPTLDGVEREAQDLADEAEPVDQGELEIGGMEPAPKPAPIPRKPAGPPPDKIITLFLLSKDNHLINGAELLQAAVNTGMEFGGNQRRGFVHGASRAAQRAGCLGFHAGHGAQNERNSEC